MQICNVNPVLKKTILPVMIATASVVSPMIINNEVKPDTFEYSTSKDAEPQKASSFGFMLSGLVGLFKADKKKEEETEEVNDNVMVACRQRKITVSDYFDNKLDKELLRNLFYNSAQSPELQAESIDNFLSEVKDNMFYQDACAEESFEIVANIMEKVKSNPRKYLSADFSCNIRFNSKYEPLEQILKSCINYVVDGAEDREEFRTEYLPEYREILEDLQ